jgi:type I restriction enzyme M protein
VAEPLAGWLEERGARAGATPTDRLLGVSKHGLIPPRGRAAADTSRHRRLEVGDIAYNPERATLGSFALCRQVSQTGWVSPDYVVFRIVDGAPFDAERLLAFLRSAAGKAEIDRRLRGSVRQRLYFKDLEQILMPMPAAQAPPDTREANRRSPAAAAS